MAALVASACGHAATTPMRPVSESAWFGYASSYIEAERNMGKEGGRKQRDAERALIRVQLPAKPVLASLIVHGDPNTRHAAIVAVLVQGLADESLAMAMLSRWQDLTRAEKFHVLGAIEDRMLQHSDALSRAEIQAFIGEHDLGVQMVILLSVRDELAAPTILPLLVEYARKGPDTVRILAYATAVKMGRSVAEELRHQLRALGATEALSLIEKWDKEGRTPWADPPEPKR